MSYRNTVEFLVSGDYALFSDPITRVGGEKTSYTIATYEALKGILHSCYWKPTIIWKIDEVRIMNQIQTESKGIRTKKYDPQEGKKNDLSIYTYLKNVRYQVRAHFEWNENRPELINDRNEHKHHNIAKRMIERGGRRDIFLGVRECQGYVEPCVFGEGDGFYDSTAELSFGFMFHGFTYADEAVRDEDKENMTVRFFHAVMKKGIIKFPAPEECTSTRHIKKMPVKTFGDGNFSGIGEFDFDNLDGKDDVI